MKKMIAIMMVGVLALTGCSVESDTVLNSDGTVVMTEKCVVSKDEATSDMTMNGKSVTSYPIQVVDGKECYVSEESNVYNNVDEYNSEVFGSSTGVGKCTSSYVFFNAATLNAYAAIGMSSTMRFTFADKIVSTNGTKVNDYTVEFIADSSNITSLSNSVDYAVTESADSEIVSNSDLATYFSGELDKLTKQAESVATTSSNAIKASKSSFTVKKGKKVSGTIASVSTGKSVKIKSVKSSNKKIAKVAFSGSKFMITGKKAGTCKVTIKSKTGGTCSVKVKVK
jgi:hypothetical protein